MGGSVGRQPAGQGMTLPPDWTQEDSERAAAQNRQLYGSGSAPQYWTRPMEQPRPAVDQALQPPPQRTRWSDQGYTWDQANQGWKMVDPVTGFTTLTTDMPGQPSEMGGVNFIAGAGGYSGIPAGYTGQGRDQWGRTVNIVNGIPDWTADTPVEPLLPMVPRLPEGGSQPVSEQPTGWDAQYPWTWPDTSRGAGAPGMMYGQVLTPVNRDDPAEVARYQARYATPVSSVEPWKDVGSWSHPPMAQLGLPPQSWQMQRMQAMNPWGSYGARQNPYGILSLASLLGQSRMARNPYGGYGK